MLRIHRHLAAAALIALPAIAVAATVPAAIRAAVADPARPAEDVARDAERKPAEVMAFARSAAGDE